MPHDKDDVHPVHEHERTDARKRIPAEAAAVGVTPAFISRLVDAFYDRIRMDEVLAPVFASKIADDAWPDHLMKMKRFWASVVLNAGIYSGRPMAVHAQIQMIENAHFPRWLALFEATLDDIAPNEKAKQLFMSKAERIAASLSNGLFSH